MSNILSELWQGVLLGNAAILTNVCILPLYPGLIAYLAGNASQNDDEDEVKRIKRQRATKWLGLLVLLGILTLMTAVGGLLYAFQQSFGSLLIWLLPVIYGIVILLGILMLTGNNPFNRLTTTQIPLLDNPYIGAYLYGILLGPMTLPCAGPIVVSAFLLGAGSITSLSSSLLFFFAFGLGFGWPARPLAPSRHLTPNPFHQMDDEKLQAPHTYFGRITDRHRPVRIGHGVASCISSCLWINVD